MRTGGRSPPPRRRPTPIFTVPALDAANARLRRLLIALHERVEAAGDAAMNRKILALYVRMAADSSDGARRGLNMRTWLIAAAAALAPALALGGAAHAAGTKTVKDWTAVCSNLGDCTAFGFSEEGGDTDAYLRIEREAGPAAQPRVTLVYDSGDKQPAQTWTLSLDGHPIAGIGPVHADGSDNGARASLTGAAAEHLIDALRNGQGLELDAGGKSLEEISLAGSAAILLWVDDQQGRVGTVTALTKKGPAPASSVHPRLAPPLVRAAPPVSQAGLPKHAPKSMIKGVEDCDYDASTGEPDDTIARLAPGVVLWGPECEMAAYNETTVFFIGDEHAGRLKRIVFPEAPGAGQPSDDLLMNVGFDAQDQTLSSFSKGRGIADCGSTEAWVWDGKAFQMAARGDHARMPRRAARRLAIAVRLATEVTVRGAERA